MDNSKDHYAPLTLLCRLQDLLWYVELAAEGELTGAERERATAYAEEVRAIYHERRYIPVQPSPEQP